MSERWCNAPATDAAGPLKAVSSGRRRIAPGRALSTARPEGEPERQQQSNCGQQHQGEGTDARDQHADAGARDAAERLPDADQRKQPLAAVGRVDVVGERPELRDDHQAEDADPDEEHHRQRDAELRQHVENRRARCKEQRDEVDQPDP